MIEPTLADYDGILLRVENLVLRAEALRMRAWAKSMDIDTIDSLDEMCDAIRGAQASIMTEMDRLYPAEMDRRYPDSRTLKSDESSH